MSSEPWRALMMLDNCRHMRYSHVRMYELYDRVRRCYVLLEARVARALDEPGVRIDQFNALRVLEGTCGLRMTELAARMLGDDSTVTRIVDSLVRRGLVERTSDSADRRVRLVALTAAGEDLLSRSMAAVDRELQQAAGLIRNGRHEQLRRRLEALCRELEKHELEKHELEHDELESDEEHYE